MSEKPPYRTVSMKTEFADALEQFIRANPQYGYRSLAQFLEDSSRRRLEELKGKEVPRMEQINFDDNGVKIHDRKLGRVADVSFRRNGIYCNLDDADDCDHIRFALLQKDIQKVIREKKAQGWKLPDV